MKEKEEKRSERESRTKNEVNRAVKHQAIKQKEQTSKKGEGKKGIQQ